MTPDHIDPAIPTRPGSLPTELPSLSPRIFRPSGVDPSLAEPPRFSECRSDADFQEFVGLRDSLPERHRLMLTPYTLSDYREGEARLFLADNFGGGYGLFPDGEIVSVFSLPGMRLGRAIIEDALLRSGTKVECFDICNKLPELYRQFGFVETGRLPWSNEQAPDGWSFERYGTPDVIVMEVNAKKLIL